jgi:hypothetical protein
MINFVFTRYLTYAIVFLEVFIVPLILTKEDFGQYEYLKNVISLSSFVLLGSHTGFVYYYYTSKKDHFVELINGSYIILITMSLIYSIYFRSFYFIPLIMCYGSTVFFEKKLQVERKLYLAILFKPVLSLISLLTLFITLNVFHFDINITKFLTIIYIVSLLFWIFLIYIFAPSMVHDIFRKWSFKKNDIIVFYNLIKAGIVENFATIILLFYFFADRFLLKNFYSEELSSYSLAFNFSQLIFVGMNSMTYVNNIEIGEKLHSINKIHIINIFKKSFLIFLLLLICVNIIGFFYQIFVQNFQNLTQYTFILSLFIGLYYTFNVIGIIPLLNKKQNNVTFFLLISLIVNLISTYFMYRYHFLPIYIILKSSILLMIFGLGTMVFSFKIIQNSKF